MANSTSTQILMDGPQNVVVKFEGILDTSDLSTTTVIDPALLATNFDVNGVGPTRLRIDKIQYNIEDLLAVNLFWDATTPIRIETLAGRGKMEYDEYGGLKNNAGTWSGGTFTPATGFTGKITATTQGWAASAVLSFALVIHCVKQ